MNFRKTARKRTAGDRPRFVRLLVETLEARDTLTCGVGSATAVLQVLQPLLVTGSVAASSPVYRFGDPVTFTASFRGMEPGSGNPEGSATFFIDGRIAGAAGLSDGAASFTTSTLTIGDHEIVALFTPAARSVYASYNTPSLTETILSLPATGSIVSSRSVARAGDPVTFTATFSGMEHNASVPQGYAVFCVDGHLAGKADLIDGVASMTTSTLTVRTHEIYAMYTPAANSVYGRSWTPWIRQIVQPVQVSGLIRSSSPLSGFGQPTMFTATLHGAPAEASVPHGTVHFIVDGRFVASGTLENNTARWMAGLLASGIHWVFAIYTPQPYGEPGYSTFTTPLILQLISGNSFFRR